MRAPEFWSRRPDAPGWESLALTPLSWLYALGGAARWALATPTRIDTPVLCVGNLVAGGAGKTPSVLALCDRLAALGVEPHVIARGYGGRVRGPHRVDPSSDTAADVGDEPLLMARRRPVWVGADRPASAARAVSAGADVVVMDDGFQNPSLAKHLSIVVIDAKYGHGNERVIPAGPLREPLSVGFGRADAAIMIGEPSGDDPWPWTPPGMSVVHARLAPSERAARLSDRRVLAFAGIGRPEKFFETLRRMGARIVETEAFPDHHPYNTAILSRLAARAQAAGAELVTTEKDATRLPASFQDRVLVVPVALGFAQAQAVDALLRPVLEMVQENRERRARSARQGA